MTNTNTNPTTTPPVLIDNPLTLLYWLFFRPLALRRYAGSIHEKLDERLNIWIVDKEVENDMRFQALCNARWWLLGIGGFFCTILILFTSLILNQYFICLIVLSLTIGYTIGNLLNDANY